jgi:hypothetical protein
MEEESEILTAGESGWRRAAADEETALAHP